VLGIIRGHLKWHHSTLDGREIRWEESIRYLDVHITSAKAFACSLANAKKSFYRAFNAVFGKVAGVASEEVTVELLKVKCLPVLLYGLEACPISNKQFNSLDFVLKGCFRKIFRTRSAEVVQNCMLIFNCMSMQECVAKRKCKFLANYVKSDNILCYVCQNTAAHELNMLGKR